MSFDIHVSGDVRDVVEAELPALVDSLIASGITAGDPDLWGPGAAADAAERLGWVQAVTVSRPLVEEIVTLRDVLRADGVTRIVLAGMGGSSLAPEVIAATAGVPLVVLDSTAPGEVAAVYHRTQEGILTGTGRRRSEIQEYEDRISEEWQAMEAG